MKKIFVMKNLRLFKAASKNVFVPSTSHSCFMSYQMFRVLLRHPADISYYLLLGSNRACVDT